jgi:hypothetical protein
MNAPRPIGDEPPPNWTIRGFKVFAAIVSIALVLAFLIAGGLTLDLHRTDGFSEFVAVAQMKSESILREVPPGAVTTGSSTDIHRAGFMDGRYWTPVVTRTYTSRLAREEIVVWYVKRFGVRYRLTDGQRTLGGSRPVTVERFGRADADVLIVLIEIDESPPTGVRTRTVRVLLEGPTRDS